MNVLDFDGTSDFLAIQNIFYNSASINGLFICTVFKTAYSATSYNSNRSFIDFDRSEFYDFYIQGNGKLELSYTAGGSTIDAPVTAGGTYNDNQRHFACGHYDNTVVNDTEIYVDGIREYVANRRATGVKIGKNTTRYGFIGDGSEASSYNSTRNNIYYDGQIGEIIVFDDLTTTAQREEVMCYLSSKRSIADACDGVGVPPIATIEYSTTETTP
ncbi:MAG: hypothetical protein H6766_01755 [Candidatus Peribacteria bacterium]|nr:MAG: hypothetical protein H6766_01755 [Candidatus Peribacteria bacterium]